MKHANVTPRHGAEEPYGVPKRKVKRGDCQEDSTDYIGDKEESFHGDRAPFHGVDDLEQREY